MKKLALLVLAASLCCIPVTAQQAEGITITAAGRADVSPLFPGGGVSFDNSALYTFIDGQLGDHFSYSICNHWLSTQPGDLYRNTFRSDDVNWVDWAYVAFNYEDFSLSAGKDVIAIGGWEMDPYDVESHSSLNSVFWNWFTVYQLGAKASWEPGNSSFTLGVSASPFSETPFQDALAAYSFQWSGEYGFFEPIWSVNVVGRERGSNPLWIASLGNKFTFGDFSCTLDGLLRTVSGRNPKGHAYASVAYNFSDKWEAILKGGIEFNANDGDDWEEDILDALCPVPYGTSPMGGIAIHYSPIENLRLHLTGAYDGMYDMCTLSLGVLYNLTILER